jgi:hypothetical protein
MLYQISRNGQEYGPYTLEDLQRYLASGNVLPTDLAKGETMTEWVPVSSLFAGSAPPGATTPASDPLAGSASAYQNVGTVTGAASAGYAGFDYAAPAYGAPNPNVLAASPYPDAPNLHWGLVLLFALLTCSLFMFIWNLVIAAWLKRVQPNATSLFYYIGAGVLAIIQWMQSATYSMHHVLTPGLHGVFGNHGGLLIGLVVWIVRLIARFSQKASLEEHFNGPEPIGLQLNGVLVFFFGGLYFQYHLNRINAIKAGARYAAAGAVRPY